MATHEESALCGLTPETPQDVAGITAITLGVADKCLWDGVQLFGAGRLDEMASFLDRARESHVDSAYQLTFGLYRLTGRQADFENIAVNYAISAGESPPNWLEAHSKQQSVGQVGEVVVRSLSEETIVEVTIKMELPWPCVIDLGSVSGFDRVGLEIFNDCLAQRLARGDKTKIVTAESLVERFFDLISKGTVKQDQPIWDFCFMYLRTKGDQQAYAGLAEKYRKGGGIPQPWKDNAWRDERDEATKIENGFTAGEGLADLNVGFSERLVREGLVASARKNRQPIRVDFTKTKNGSLLDMTHVHAFVRTLVREQVDIHFVNVNEIHHAILRMMGIHRWVKMSIAGSTS